MIIVGFNLFRNSFSMISRVLKYFIKFYRNIIAHGVSHSIRTQKHFRSSQLLFGWSEATTELLLSCFCFRQQAGWRESCVLIGYASGIELMQGIKIYKATKTENLPEASESRSSWNGFRQIITLDMIVYRSDLDLRSDFPFISLNDVWRRKLPVFWMLGAWIWVFRHLENPQKSQNFDRVFQVQGKGETEGEII